MFKFIKSILTGGIVFAIIAFIVVTALLIKVFDFVGGILNVTIRAIFQIAVNCYPITIVLAIVGIALLVKHRKDKRLA
jgi:hypothetical protein